MKADAPARRSSGSGFMRFQKGKKWATADGPL